MCVGVGELNNPFPQTPEVPCKKWAWEGLASAIPPKQNMHHERSEMGDSLSRSEANNSIPPAGYDRVLVFCVVALLSLGLVMVYSATIAGSSQTLDVSYRHFIRHLVHIAVGTVLLLAAAHVNMQKLQGMSKPLLIGGLLLLVAVLLPGVGVEVNGSKRWIGLGEISGIRVQASEFMKIAVIIYFADYLSRKRADLHLFTVGVINIGLVLGVIGLLLLLEPDVGTTVLLTTTVFIMMFLAGVRCWHFASGIVAVIVLMSIIAQIPDVAIKFAYIARRLLSFSDPWADPFDSGFQLIQALIAIGRGGWFGIGLGSSIQKLYYLPHAGNDFLIAIIGEELGALGIFCVLGLFAILLYRAFAIGKSALNNGQRFAGLTAMGIGILLALQASVHIGVNTGLLPTKGLTLPMMSYGGSSMLSSMIAIGLLFAIGRNLGDSTRERENSDVPIQMPSQTQNQPSDRCNISLQTQAQASE